MSSELIINVRPHEVRIALVENQAIVEYYLERASTGGIAGNIYKGRVVRVLPGMQAAFIDIGQERAAFLYVADVWSQSKEFESLLNVVDDPHLSEDAPSTEFEPEEERFRIEDLLTEGQEILVQVAKEPIGQKGARVTTYVTLPGRHLVLMPTVDHIGISRRITEENERNRLKSLIMEIRNPQYGFIARTASEGVDQEKLKSEMDFMIRLWGSIQARAKKATAPSLIHQDLDATLRTVRDLFTQEVDRLVVDDANEYQRILEFIETFSPNLRHGVHQYSKNEPIFDAYALETEINRAMAKKVWLKSGGYIVIEDTEALVSIDVNTGRFVGKHNLEETIVKTNLEAVKEIAYQLRLRNIGGLIVIDFIDMEREDDREKVWSALVEALKKDKAKTNVLKMSELGLIEMTRQRTRENINRLLREPCFYCQGEGSLLSKTSVCYEAFRDLEREAARTKEASLVLSVNPLIKEMMLDEERHALGDLEDRLGKRVIINDDAMLHMEEYHIRSA